MPTNKPVAWITGAAGLIGHDLVRLAPRYAPQFDLIPCVRQLPARSASTATLDSAAHLLCLELTDNRALAEAFRLHPPDLVVHCAAMSRSPECQTHPDRARAINVESTQRLTDLAADIPLVFLSTDLVFDGRTGGYTESSLTRPLSVYGETKQAAEHIVRQNPKHLVIRTSLNGGTSPSGDRGFNEALRAAWKTGEALRLFVDEFRCPIPAPVTARAIWELVGQGASGLYHVAGTERLSRWDIGRQIAARWPELRPRLEPSSIRDYGGAPRSPDCSLDCSKAQARLSFPLPGLTDWLQAHPEVVF